MLPNIAEFTPTIEETRSELLKRIANDNIQLVMIEFFQEDHAVHEWDLIYQIPLQVIFSLSRDGWNGSYDNVFSSQR